MANGIHLTFVDTRNLYGTMNTGTVRLSNLTNSDKRMLMQIHDMLTLEELTNYTLTPDDKRRVFAAHRQQVGEYYGFDGRKMFMADQKNLDGSVFEITRDYVEANPNGWTDIPEDILKIRENLPGVALGHPVADCPVVIAEDKTRGITTVAHCGGEMIDKKLPMMAVEALYREGSKPEDVHVYVGAKAGPNWTYTNNTPVWAKDEQLWSEAITPGQQQTANGSIDVYHIDLQKALDKEFSAVGLHQGQVIYDPHDTITDSNYYSNSEARVNPEKFGRQFVGAFYQEDNQKDERGRSR